MYLQLLNEYILGSLHCMMNKSHMQNTVLKAISIYIYILIHRDKNVELQL